MTVTTTQRNKAVENGKRIAFEGHPYQLAAAGPNLYDCSGLVLQAWWLSGYRFNTADGKLPHNTVQQAELLKAVPYTWDAFKLAQPGDLIFYYGGAITEVEHVAMLVEKDFDGLNLVAQATQEGTLSEVIRMMKYARPTFIGYVR